MAQPTDRAGFRRYCLTKLGEPVIKVNLSDDQIEDRIDEAISFWNEYHFNGMDLVYLKHQLTQTDVDNGYIDVPPSLIGVNRIFDLATSTSAGTGMFNVTYQFVLNNLQDLTGYSIQNYFMTMQSIRFLQEWLVGATQIRYNRHSNRVYIDADKAKMTPGYYIIVEAYDVVDGNVHSDVWSDRWLQNYATVLIKEQWGSVLTKFTGVQLMGGISFNGAQIYEEAVRDRKEMERQAIENFQPLVYQFTG